MKSPPTHKNKQAQKPSHGPKKIMPTWRERNLFEVLIFCFSFLLFANSIPNDYNMDDELVTLNHRLTAKGVSAIPEIFTSAYYQDESGYAYEYRPLVLATFAIEHDIFGENPHWSHFWNVLLYSLACVLLYKVLKLLFRQYSPWVAISVSLLFVAHPAHTEIVCSIKNRDEILGLIFSLLTFYTILKALLYNKNILLALVPLLFLLALMSKVTIVPFVVLVPVCLILLTEASLVHVLLITLLLLIPAFPFLSFGNTFNKVLLILGISLFDILLYAMVNLQSSILWSRQSLWSVYNKGFLEMPSAEENKSVDILSSLRASLPDIKVLLSPFSPIIILLTALYYWGATHGHILLVALIPVLFFFLMRTAGRILSWWAALGFYLCLYLCFDLNVGWLSTFYVQLLVAFICYQLFQEQRYLLLPVLIAYVVFVIQNIKRADYPDIGMNIALMLLINYKIPRYILFVIMLALQLFYMHDKSWLEARTYLNSGVLATLIIIVIFNFKEKRFVSKLIWVYPLLALIILFSVRGTSGQSLTVAQVVNPIATTVNKTKIKIIETKENRPLDFAEECVNLKTPTSIKIGTSLSILLHYLQKVILPYPMSFYYGYKFIYPQKVSDPLPLLGLFLYLLLIIATIYCVIRAPLYGVGLLIYLLSIAVFSNYLSPIPGMLAERFLLIPSLGWLIILTAILFKLFGIDLRSKLLLRDIPQKAKYTFAGILLLYSTLSFARNLCWKDAITLFENDISYVDSSSQAHNLLALRLMNKSFTANVSPADQSEYRKKALLHFRKAIDIYPQFLNATFDLGRTYLVIGNTDSAIVFFKKALDINPDFTNASMSIGDILMSQNRIKETEPYFQNAIRVFPKDFLGYDKLSYALFLGKDYEKSIDVLKSAMAEMPENPQPYIRVAKVYHTINKDDSTRYWLQKALVVDPKNQEANALLQSLGKN